MVVSNNSRKVEPARTGDIVLMPLLTLPSGRQYFIDEELYDLLMAVDEATSIAFKRGLLAAARYIQQHPCTCQRTDLVAGILELKDE